MLLLFSTHIEALLRESCDSAAATPQFALINKAFYCPIKFEPTLNFTLELTNFSFCSKLHQQNIVFNCSEEMSLSD